MIECDHQVLWLRNCVKSSNKQSLLRYKKTCNRHAFHLYSISHLSLKELKSPARQMSVKNLP